LWETGAGLARAFRAGLSRPKGEGEARGGFPQTHRARGPLFRTERSRSSADARAQEFGPTRCLREEGPEQGRELQPQPQDPVHGHPTRRCPKRPVTPTSKGIPLRKGPSRFFSCRRRRRAQVHHDRGATRGIKRTLPLVLPHILALLGRTRSPSGAPSTCGLSFSGSGEYLRGAHRRGTEGDSTTPPVPHESRWPTTRDFQKGGPQPGARFASTVLHPFPERPTLPCR